MATKIHPTAIVHPDAQFDHDVEIGPYTIIGEDVQIGAGTVVGPNCVIEFTHMGKGNKIYSNASLGTAPQDISYDGTKTLLEIGDNNTIREYVFYNRGSHKEGLTKIGSNCTLMASTHIAHDCHIGNGVILISFAALAGHCRVGDRAVISSFAAAHQFVRIGTMAMISAGTLIGKDIPPYVTAQGERAKLVGLNLVGLRRNGVSRESIASIKNAYKTLFLSGKRLEVAISELREGAISPEASHMIDFCEESFKTRGIARSRMKSMCEDEDEE